MRIRLATILTAAIVFVPVATASANPSAPQPAKKCPEAMNFILDHCD